MAKLNTTRDTIIAEALSQAVVVGLEGLSLGVLAARLDLSKSGLFAHFKSKEALQIAVVEAALERFARQVVAPAHREASPRARLDRLFAGYLDWIGGDRQVPGCLFITAIQEYDDRPGPVRDLLVSSQGEWREGLEALAREAGETPADAKLLVFEIIGVALAYQHALKLFHDGDARTMAQTAYARLFDDL